jgi:hypothetical protein
MRVKFLVCAVFTAILGIITFEGDAGEGAAIGKKWNAQWIAHPGVEGSSYSVQHFRRVIELPAVPVKWMVRISADPRCRLFVNGVEVWTGPARSDLEHWPFATIDLSKYLKPGKNVLGATVWNHGEYKPWSQISQRTAFIMDGDDLAEVVNTGEKWKVFADPSFSVADKTRHSSVPTGYSERFDTRTHPWGWMEQGFDDSAWVTPRTLGAGTERGVRDAGSSWWLVPQAIPAQEQVPQRFSAVARSTGDAPDAEFLQGRKPWVIPANSKVSILVDQKELTTAYPEIVVTGGRDAEIQMRCAEALVDVKGQKGNRNEIQGRSITSTADVFVLDGASERLLRTHLFRTFRYLQLEVKTAGDPLTIHDLRSVFTAYPFRENASFKSSDPVLADLWRVGFRTLRLCSGDTFYDCPYYEQLQYVGDTRVEALISIYTTGDDRLMRNAIVSFYNSLMPEGLTSSRYPSAVRQIIPPYSLFWVAMIHDYWMNRRDDVFVREMLNKSDGVLTWFERRLRPDGILGPLEWWNFGDWSKGWPNGVPPGAVEGGSAFISLQFILAVRQAAEMFQAFGEPERAKIWRQKADRVARAVNELCWVESKGLYADTPEKKSFSQHVNSLAVVSKTITGDRARKVVMQVLDDPSLTQCTFYFRFYVIRAMAAMGLGDRYIPELKPWRDMLELGLTTFAEKPEPTRSDCHAWSACPNYDFLALICGITPDAPGFHKVRIAPALGALQWAEGKMPHPDGEISVHLERKPGGAINAVVSLPSGLSGVFVWKGKDHQLVSGIQTINL